MWLCVRYEGQWLLSLGKLTIQWCDWRWKICTTQHFTPVYPIKSPYSAYFVLLFLQCMAPDCDWLYASVWLCLPHSLAPSARSFCRVMRTSSYSSTVSCVLRGSLLQLTLELSGICQFEQDENQVSLLIWSLCFLSVSSVRWVRSW